MKTCPPCNGDCVQGRECPADPGNRKLNLLFAVFIGLCGAMGVAAFFGVLTP